MQADIQKATIWKRLAAWILDLILLAVLASAAMWLFSVIFNYGQYSQKVDEAYTRYETEYGVTFQVSAEEYQAFTDEERQNWDDAYAALVADQEAMQAYNMTVNLIMLMTTLGILLATLIIYVIVPLFLKNGQTLGKKAFALGVIRQDGVKMNNMQLFVRALLGQFTLETMIPVYVMLMVIWNTVGILGPIVLFLLTIGQLVCMGVSSNNAALHDLLAGTVVVDLASQKVFDSQEALIEYTKQVHAERAARQDY